MAKTIEGWLIRYGAVSLPLELPSGRSVYEVIAKDAFVDSVNAINIGAATIEANIEHVDDAITRIGLSGKNVVVENRHEGVYATLAVLDDSLSNDVYIKAQAGIISGFSVEFDPATPGTEPAYTMIDGNYVRTWPRLTLRGFAICAHPAYPSAQIVRAGTKDTQSLRTAAQSARLKAQQAEAAKRAQWADCERFLASIRI